MRLARGLGVAPFVLNRNKDPMVYRNETKLCAVLKDKGFEFT